MKSFKGAGILISVAIGVAIGYMMENLTVGAELYQ